MSEIGEQWSPKMAPASTELMAPNKIEYSPGTPKPSAPPRVTVRGITSGIMMAMVAQDVPVANAMAAEVRNTRAGRIWSGNESSKSCARY